MSRTIGSLLGALALAGCAGPGKREAAALTEAVDRFRDANDASRSAKADALAAVPCSDARVCDAKQACVAAIEPTARALALKDEVARKLADLEAARLAPDSSEAQALPLKLDEASRLLREGHKKMDECDTKLAELRVAYGS
jgi:hypothetical protein